MTKRWLLVIGVIVVLLAAYAAGYWPERQQRQTLETEVETLRPQLAEAQAQVRAARVLGELLNLIDATAALNYGEAQKQSSAFFDAVRAEATRTSLPDVRAALDAVLQERDTITSALARGEAAALQRERMIEVRLRRALGYPVDAAPGVREDAAPGVREDAAPPAATP